MAYDHEEQEQLASLKAWWNQFGNLVTWLVIAVLVAYAGWSGWRYYQRDQSAKSAVLYEEIVKAAEAKDLPKVTRAAGDMEDRFARTPYAQMGALVAARAANDANDTKTAKAQLQWVIDNGRADEYKAIARLRLAGLGGLGTEPIDEGLHMRLLRGDAVGHRGLLGGAFGLDADEFVVAAGREGDFAAVEMGDAVHAAIQQVAVMRDHERGTGEFGKPGLEPHRGFKVEMVGGFVEQQHIGRGEQHGGQRHAHPPAARERIDRPRLGLRIEAEPGQDRRRPRRRGVRPDCHETIMHLGQPVRIGIRVFGLGQQGEALLVAFQHAIEQRGIPVRRLLPDLAEPRAGGKADRTAVERQFPADRLEQG